MGMTFYLCILPPQTQPLFNHEKNIRSKLKNYTKSKLKNILQNITQNPQGHQKPRKSERLSQFRGTERDLTSTYDVDPGVEREYQVKTRKI